MRTGSLWWLACVGLGAGCGGQSGAPHASVAGTFAGAQVTVQDSSAFQGVTSSTAYLGEVLADASNVCSLLQQHTAKANATGLALQVVSISDGTTPPSPIAPGTYAITNGDPARDTSGRLLVVTVSYNSLDAECQPTYADTAALASAGTVTIDSVGASVSGSFDVTFPSGDHLRGTFDSPVCASAPAPPASPTPSVSGAGQTLCQP